MSFLPSSPRPSTATPTSVCGVVGGEGEEIFAAYNVAALPVYGGIIVAAASSLCACCASRNFPSSSPYVNLQLMRSLPPPHLINTPEVWEVTDGCNICSRFRSSLDLSKRLEARRDGLLLLREGRLPNPETQDGSSRAFTCSGRRSNCHQLAELDQKCLKAFKTRLKTTLTTHPFYSVDGFMAHNWEISNLVDWPGKWWINSNE
ncbi:hypothetical protein J6590_048564 [Homalodisca vitripennis]|nr:hypothetical protein J6590_048564 [Homalodisca vitripennis]